MQLLSNLGSAYCSALRVSH